MMGAGTFETITKEIFIECRPATMFSFFTDPDKLVRWMGRHVLLEPSIGGKYRIDINGNDVAMGEYKELVPNEKIVMTWGWDKSKLLPASEIASHQAGWTHYMSRLLTLAEGQDPGIDPWSERSM